MEWLSEIVSFIAGCIAGGLAVKVVISKKNVGNVTTQSDLKAGGDIAGRDVIK